MAVDAKGLWFEIQAAYTDQVTPGVTRTAQTVDQQANRMQQSLNKVGGQGPGPGLTGYMGAFRGLAQGAQMASSAIPGLNGAVGHAAGTMATMATGLGAAKEGFNQIAQAAKNSSFGVAVFAAGAAACTGALILLTHWENQATEALARAEAEFSKNPWRQKAQDAIEAYHWNQQLAKMYGELAGKAKRTAEEERTLMKVREQMNANPAFKWGATGPDYAKYGETTGVASRQRLLEMRSDLETSMLYTAGLVSKARAQGNADALQNQQDKLNKIREALAALNREIQQSDEKTKKITGTTLPKQSELLQEIEGELNDVTRATWALYEAQVKASTPVDISGIGAASLVNGPLGRDFSSIYQRNADDQARALREQQAAQRAAYDAIGIGAEQARVSVEGDFTLSPEALESQRAYIDMMEEIRYLEAELAQLSPEEAAAQRENYYNRMAIASQKYQTTLKRLEQEQSVVRNVTQNMTRAFQSAYVAAVLGQQSFAQAFRMAAAEYIAGESAKAMIGAIMEMAHGFAALASHRYADAAFHFKASAFYAAVGAASGMAAKALAGGGGGAGGGEGGGGGQQYGPREYSNDDLARIRAQGQQATGGGADGGQPVTTTIINNNNFKIAEKIDTPDPKAMARFVRSQGAQLMEGIIRESSRNGSVATRFGRLSNREE